MTLSDCESVMLFVCLAVPVTDSILKASSVIESEGESMAVGVSELVRVLMIVAVAELVRD